MRQGRERGEGGEREACGPSKFSIPKTSQDKLQLELKSGLRQALLYPSGIQGVHNLMRTLFLFDT